MRIGHSGSMTRRDFLRSVGAGLTAAASGLEPGRAGATTQAAAGADRQALVLGAGLAGLAAAYELRKAGFAVTVLEARSRPGGRVLTYRDPFADGLHAEMGAEYVDATDEFDHRYCKEFGLKVMTARLYDGIFLRGRGYRMADFKQRRLALPYAGTAAGVLFGQEQAYTRRLLEQIRDPDHLPEEILKLDNLSVAELLLRQGAPEDVLALYTYLNATESTARPEEMSALTMVKSHLQRSDFNEQTDEGRILGGNDQLPKALARALADTILYRRPVRRIAHDHDGAEVWFEESGSLRSMRAPHLVIAIPFKVLRRIEITPELSAAKMRCIRELRYGAVMKIAMQYQQRFWDRPGSLGQRVFTDTRLRRIYHHSIDQPGPRGIVLTFTSGADAESLGALTEEERLAVALTECSKIWPEAPQYWEAGVTKYWNEDEWVQGSYSFAGVGQERDFLELARRSEGRIHFAGEHTSVYRASMNGALESGVRAAREIAAAAG